MVTSVITPALSTSWGALHLGSPNSANGSNTHVNPDHADNGPKCVQYDVGPGSNGESVNGQTDGSHKIQHVVGDAVGG